MKLCLLSKPNQVSTEIFKNLLARECASQKTLQHNNRMLLHATNKTDKIWKIKKGEIMGSMDMRTLGYFTVTRENLNRIMKDHCKFLTEEETYEYFGLLNKDHEDIINYAQDQVRKIQNLQDNTKLVDRVKSGEKDTNIVPDKDKNPYP